jgi:uncharacterized protein
MDFQVNSRRGDCMRKHIEEVLRRIEYDYDVKILYACDIGSRAMGLESSESDYDIRFIYVHRLEWYLKIDKGQDVIEAAEQGKLSFQVHPSLDISGWELAKTLKLYRKSNPSVLEWLHSKLVYYQEYSTIEKLKAVEQEIISPKPFIMHYLNIAKRNFSKGEIKKHEVKKYLYILRSILASRWILKKSAAPPVDFAELLQLMPGGNLKDLILKMIITKKAGEALLVDNIESVNQFIIDEIESLEIEVKKLEGRKADPTEKLNKIFREAIMEVWN